MNLQLKIFTLLIVLILFNSCSNNSNINGRNDQWGFIGPGGGGAMFNPSINPSDPDNIFVSCDMTGSFVTYNGGKNWRRFNLGWVTKFYSFDRKKSNIVYTATSNKLFKSLDKGVSWRTIYPRQEEIVSIHGHGDHADEVLVLKDSSRTIIEKLVVDPDNSQKLFLLTKKEKANIRPRYKGDNNNYITVILISEDGGAHWETLDELRFELNNIFIDPTSPKDNRTIYVSGKDGLGMKKDDDWRNIRLPYRAGRITQFIDGIDTKTNQHIIYAISGQSYFNPNGLKNDSRIYMTNNGGENWNRIDTSLHKFKIDSTSAPKFRSIATSYYHPETIYVSFSKLKTSNDTISFGVAKSTDFGVSWEIVWNDKASGNDKNNLMMSALNRKQGWIDERFGPGWGENPFNMTVSDNNPDLTFTTDFGRIIKTMDGGVNWEQVYTNKIENGGWKSRGIQVTTGYMMAFDPFDSLHVFMADTDTGLMESFDGAKSWNSATKDNGVPNRWINTTYWVLFDPDVKNKLWAVMSANHDLPRPKMWRNKDMSQYEGGVLVSVDGGKTWKTTSKDIGEFAPTHIIMDPKSDSKNRTLYVCAFGKGVYKSVDGGGSWQQKNNGIEGVQPSAWRLTQKNNGDLFLIVFRKSEDGSIGNEMDGALYKSIDGAENWEKMKLPNGVNGPSSLVIDPDNSNRLILSAWGRRGKTALSGDSGGGIYVSEDNGLTWVAVLTKDQHIHDLTIDANNGVFYAAGFNSSAYRSEDRGRSWKRIKGFNFKWGKRVQPDPYDSEKVFIITFGGGVWHGPAKGDENALEDIITAQNK